MNISSTNPQPNHTQTVRPNATSSFITAITALSNITTAPNPVNTTQHRAILTNHTVMVRTQKATSRQASNRATQLQRTRARTSNPLPSQIQQELSRYNCSRFMEGDRPRMAKIVGGKNAKAGDTDYVVMVKNTELGSVCTGQVIDSRHVLTAAHCVAHPEDGYHSKPKRAYLNEIKIRHGGKSWRELFSDRSARFNYDIEAGYIPAGAIKNDTLDYGFDIAVLRAVKALPSSKINLINQQEYCELLSAMNSSSISGALNQHNQNVEFFGYGVDKKSDGSFFTHEHLRQVGMVATDISTDLANKTDTKMIRAIPPTGIIQDTCAGDSGGPMVFKTKANAKVLAGVVSYGNDECTGETQATNIFEHKKWIDGVVSQDPTTISQSIRLREDPNKCASVSLCFDWGRLKSKSKAYAENKCKDAVQIEFEMHNGANYQYSLAKGSKTILFSSGPIRETKNRYRDDYDKYRN